MTDPLRVLVIEDAVADAELIARALRGQSELIYERVEDASSLRIALEEQSWDVIICDWSLPCLTAPAVLELVKELGLDIPFIIVSGTIGEETAVDAMRAGARDYVLKDRLARLSPAVEREVRESKARAAHRRGAAALRASEARFERLAESGIVGIVIADRDGSVLEANQTFLDMLGYSPDELRKRALHLRDMTPPGWQRADSIAVERLEGQGVARPWEKEFLRKDGTRVPVLLGMAMLDGFQSIAFVTDLTERKRSEQLLRRTEEQLRQMQKMEAIGSLAGGVAHDFNNLLSVILSYSTMLAAQLKPGDPMLADVQEIRIAGERASDLTRQLLAFGRRQILQPTIVSMNDVAVGMEKMLRRLIGEDIELVVLRTSGLGKIEVDPGQLEQIIMNLVVNARDAMPSGGKLTIETSNVELDQAYAAEHVGVAPGRYVMLMVTDTGIGMDTATQARMFEPFFTTKEQGKGTGLGLATVFGIVQQSGGRIWVYSEAGKGTTFKIYFPRVYSAATTDRPASTPAPSTLSGTETILVAEDDERVRTLVCAILRRHGYHVLEAQSAGDALLICEHHTAAIQLLLTDVVMPKMSGRQLAERLRIVRPTLKVLYMSGYTDDSILHHGVLDSGVAFLQKPITPDMLSRKVRAVLDQP